MRTCVQLVKISTARQFMNSSATQRSVWKRLDSARCFKPFLKVTTVDQVQDIEFLGVQFEQQASRKFSVRRPCRRGTNPIRRASAETRRGQRGTKAPEG